MLTKTDIENRIEQLTNAARERGHRIPDWDYNQHVNITDIHSWSARDLRNPDVVWKLMTGEVPGQTPISIQRTSPDGSEMIILPYEDAIRAIDSITFAAAVPRITHQIYREYTNKDVTLGSDGSLEAIDTSDESNEPETGFSIREVELLMTVLTITTGRSLDWEYHVSDPLDAWIAENGRWVLMTSYNDPFVTLLTFSDGTYHGIQVDTGYTDAAKVIVDSIADPATAIAELQDEPEVTVANGDVAEFIGGSAEGGEPA